ncbi:glycoside hydrolase family 16 protein [Piedraia hortae CBS 480.64]|uniref:Glycoside hydrolase family 16 protein n=1 Tax=Piedraia hortae CBS 480.64 TaxID=1314780 RepID=A0A6A7C7E6_9PEZI|nr:glycoside hydrolase family 16 protein [Piedraia hortae CBS 480.64]
MKSPSFFLLAIGHATAAVVYDILNKDVVRALGQDARVGTPSTKITFGAKVSTNDPFVADKAVIAVRREGTENYDTGNQNRYSFGTQEKTFTASATFPEGHYTFWFAYLKDGVWHESDKRAFTISNNPLPDVPLDPVAPSEPGSDVLKFVGSDTCSTFANQAVRFDARLSSPTPITLDTHSTPRYENYAMPYLSFIVRSKDSCDSQDCKFDTDTHLMIPAVIDSDTRLNATGYFPAGEYTYWVGYESGGTWHNLGSARNFTVAPAPVVPVPGAGNSAWKELRSAWDDFTGDWSKWEDLSVHGYDFTGQLGYKKSNIAFKNGNLVLTARKETVSNTKDGTKSYSAAGVQSLFDIPGQPSYVEVRAKVLDENANVLSAIWMQTFPVVADKNPNPEVDIQETFDYSNLISTLHTWPKPQLREDDHDLVTSAKSPTGVVDTSLAFHTYGFERRDGWLRFYFDRKLMWYVKPNIASFATMPRRLLLSLEGHLGAPNDQFLPADYLIDYVHTYTYKV